MRGAERERPGRRPKKIVDACVSIAVICHGYEHSAPFDDVTNISMCAALTVGGGGYRPSAWKRILEVCRITDPQRIELPQAALAPPREMLLVGDPRFGRADAWWRT
jgi:hypothetical protein